MRDWVVGCTGIFLGVFIGAILALFGMTFLDNSRPSLETVAQPGRPDITITASGPFVISQLQDVIKQSGMANQASVALVPPNRFLITMVTSIGFLGQNLGVNTTATMSVRVVNGRALLTLEKVDVVGLNVPSDLVTPVAERMRAQSEDQLNRLISRSLQGTTLKLSNVRVAADSVQIDFSAR